VMVTSITTVPSWANLDHTRGATRLPAGRHFSGIVVATRVSG
jgi:hypothetical protein